MIRVLIVDDHEFVRTGLTALLATTDDLEVVGQCSAGEQVVETAGRVHPDLVLMDNQMGAMSGLAATRALLAAQPAVRVLILTGSATTIDYLEAAASGARGLLLKGRPSDLLAAVRTIANGGTCWPTTTRRRVAVDDSCAEHHHAGHETRTGSS
jgi:DNA-binding NarL/FixJ family response regulator